MDTKNHEKKEEAILVLQRVNFFSKYMIIKGLYISNTVCWVFDQKA